MQCSEKMWKLIGELRDAIFYEPKRDAIVALRDAIAELEAHQIPSWISLRETPVSFGGGFCATISSLGDQAFVGDGDTPQEALENLGACLKEIVEEDKSDVRE